jgi:hypothetical protein
MVSKDSAHNAAKMRFTTLIVETWTFRKDTLDGDILAAQAMRTERCRTNSQHASMCLHECFQFEGACAGTKYRLLPTMI